MARKYNEDLLSLFLLPPTSNTKKLLNFRKFKFLVLEVPKKSENKYNVFRRSDKKVNRKDVGLILPVMSQ